jgi:hypothetical protein
MTNKMCITPPIVDPVINPKAHNTKRITKIVQSMNCPPFCSYRPIMPGMLFSIDPTPGCLFEKDGFVQMPSFRFTKQ